MMIVSAAAAAASRPMLVPSSTAPQQTVTPSAAADQRSGTGSNWQTVNGYDRPKATTDMRCVCVLLVIFFTCLLAAV